LSAQAIGRGVNENKAAKKRTEQAWSVRERSGTSPDVAELRNERRDLRTRTPGVWTQAKRDRFLTQRRAAKSADPPPKADTTVADDMQAEPAQADAGGTLAHLADEIAALEQRLVAEGACAPDVRDLIARMREHVMDLHRRRPGRRARGRSR